MRDLNSVIITGRVGQNIELKTTGSGKYVVNFNLAVQNDDTTNWILCVAWEKTAEALNKYAHKGDRLTIKGRLQTREWEQNGQKRRESEVWVEWIQFLTGSKTQASNPPESQYNIEEEGDDLPF